MRTWTSESVLTTKELANYLRVGVDTVYQRLPIPYYTVGKRKDRRFKMADIRKFLDDHEEKFN